MCALGKKTKAAEATSYKVTARPPERTKGVDERGTRGGERRRRRERTERADQELEGGETVV